ncbi:helix-turn-helix domain-containing protein [Lawsonella clevelandensis]|uniref:helix-turn-helix domain-containing protein n=1 Tax=Lawsonella clevelandensis TaxID=1528099 RepID=UPI00290FBA03|nr:helix-turn-helix domain-containing protein [Lawsonella clevelandensis]MDU7192802.1 helix-turn-helix domain-containing protein [Lawsonella clevelandensis]
MTTTSSIPVRSRFLTVAQAAEECNVSQDTIRRLINDRKLKAGYFRSHVLRIERKELERFISSCFAG